MLSIKNGDILIKVSGLVGEKDARPIKSSLVMVGDVFPCTCAPHHALVTRASKPPLRSSETATHRAWRCRRATVGSS